MNRDTLEDLQTRLAFQEQALTELNNVITEQTLHIGQLEKQIQALAGKYRDLRDEIERSPATPASERPPHY